MGPIALSRGNCRIRPVIFSSCESEHAGVTTCSSARIWLQHRVGAAGHVAFTYLRDERKKYAVKDLRFVVSCLLSFQLFAVLELHCKLKVFVPNELFRRYEKICRPSSKNKLPDRFTWD